MIRIAIINSNYVSISQNTKKGTEIFDYILIKNLARQSKKRKIAITAFASGNSRLPVHIESINYLPSTADKDVGIEHHKTFELALISKAFSKQNEFDLYHVNIGNGDVVLPFAPFVTKPIIVTMHGSFLEEQYNKKYLGLFKNLKNIYFVSISNAQRKPLPQLNYVATIYHGVDEKNTWTFHPTGDDYIIWAGRAIKNKGIDTVISVIKKTKKKAKIFPMVKEESPHWIKKLKETPLESNNNVNFSFDLSRHKLAHEYRHSKVFLFPIQWEEPFGMVMIESMACGTPVVAFARGSVPEVVVDGVTGYLVNPSDEDLRGNYIIKKTGIDGLCEAIEKIYSMPKVEYMAMRKKCRERVEEKFTVKKMISQYVDTYKKVLATASAYPHPLLR